MNMVMYTSLTNTMYLPFPIRTKAVHVNTVEMAFYKASPAEYVNTFRIAFYKALV